MTDNTEVVMDTQQVFSDLKELLFEPFRSAFLHRLAHGSKYSDHPTVMIESVSRSFRQEISYTKREIQNIIDRHVVNSRSLRSPTHQSYAPEVVKELIDDIGREAWEKRYHGPAEVELKVRASSVQLYQIRHPDNMLSNYAQTTKHL